MAELTTLGRSRSMNRVCRRAIVTSPAKLEIVTTKYAVPERYRGRKRFVVAIPQADHQRVVAMGVAVLDFQQPKIPEPILPERWAWLTMTGRRRGALIRLDGGAGDGRWAATSGSQLEWPNARRRPAAHGEAAVQYQVWHE